MSTIIVSAIIGAAVVAIIISEIKKRKAGKCSCSCGNCALKDKCHK